MADEKPIQHSERIRIERAMMDFFQQPRGVVRARIAEAAKGAVARQQLEAINKGVREFSKRVEETQQLPARPLPDPNSKGGGQGIIPPVPGGVIVAVTGNFNGSEATGYAYFQDLPA